MPSTISLGVGVLGFELRDVRQDLPVHEPPDRLHDLLLHIGQAIGLREASHGAPVAGGGPWLPVSMPARATVTHDVTHGPQTAGRAAAFAATLPCLLVSR